jgi:molybdopterin converting factor small subunit
MARVSLATMLAERAAGRNSLLLSGRTLGEVLDALCREHPALAPVVWEAPGTLNEFLVCFVNQRDARDLQGLATPVGAADEIMVVGAAEGG